MKVERLTIQACCGRMGLIFKTDQMLTAEFIPKLVENGFKESEHFTKAGILYVDNMDLIVTGPLGSDRLQIKCKRADCAEKLNEFEALLQTLG
jgi:hypothetical protein